MADPFRPETAEDVRAVVADALAAGTALEVLGGGARRAIGRPVDADYALSVSQLAGVSLYEPDELVLRAGPGTPMDQIQLQLDQHGQMLAFEPPDYGPLLGLPEGQGTLGGTIAGNLSGPRRVKSGAARDHFLGVEAVSGRGELFKSGGRVVKNVTGYDLCKLMCGSWGTLGIMTEVTVKVLPAPQRARTVLVAGDEADTAVQAMTHALSSPHDISGAAWLPADAAAHSTVSYVSEAGRALAALRLEGIGASVDARCAALRDELSRFGDAEELHTHNTKAFWSEVRDVRVLAPGDEDAVWRVSIAPAAASAFVAAVESTLTAKLFLDWGGGLAWVQVAGSGDGGAAAIRNALAVSGGHATLIRAPEVLRRSVPVFQPEPGPVARLTKNLKEAFDPNAVLNPGRMYEGL